MINTEQEHITPVLVEHLQGFIRKWLKESVKNFSKLLIENALDRDKRDYVTALIAEFNDKINHLQDLAQYLEELYHNLIFELID